MPKTYVFTADAAGERLDRFLAQQMPDVSRSHLQKLIEDGLVTVSSRAAKASLRLRTGDGVSVTVPEPEPLELKAQAIPLNVVYEDGDLLVVDKPAGMTVHPAPGHPSETLVNALLAHCPDLQGISGTQRPGIVHRLDKETSGLIVVAKNDLAQQGLQRQFKDRTVAKRYVALAKGRVEPATGVIDAPLGRDPRNRKRIAVVADGRQAQTRYRVLEHLDGATLVEVTPKTGRTHQIRAHFASIRRPLVGDSLYGGRWVGLHRQFLHAAELAFKHPRTGKDVRCTSPLPQDLRRALERWRAGR